MIFGSFSVKPNPKYRVVVGWRALAAETANAMRRKSLKIGARKGVETKRYQGRSKGANIYFRKPE